MVHVLLLIVCAVAIYLACEWFVNAVEWLGARMAVGSVAVGSILAAVGTALPESIVTLMAVCFGSKDQGADIGVGAALGGPLVVGTIAYAVTGAMLLWKHAHTPGSDSPDYDDFAGVDLARMGRDQIWFICVFIFKITLGLVTFAFKPWLGIAFFIVYGIYFHQEMSDSGEVASSDDLEPLKFSPKTRTPKTWIIVAQTLIMLVIIFGSSQLFVKQLEWIGPAVGLPAQVIALLLSPVATELPEILNAIIWVRQGKTHLALANISGAMMIQATVPSGIGILGTPWMFGPPAILSGIVTLASVVYLTILFHKRQITPARLCVAVVFYLIFAAGLVIMHV